MQKLLVAAVFAALPLLSVPVAAATPPAPAPKAAAAQPADAAIDQALAGKHRSEANRARDVYRHPKQTLGFFGVSPEQNIIEITPGGGWYTEVLAPLTHGKGHLTAAVVDPTSAKSDNAKKYYTRTNQEFADKLAADKELYGEVKTVAFDISAPKFGPDGAADVVLTFRNVHNWLGSNSEQAMFNGFFAALKPGGTLGVVEHRAKPGTSRDDSKKSGYMDVDFVKTLAKNAGFELAAESEINANPKDTKDYEGGVWTLPPTYGAGDKDREKYKAIGESDRMTLRFVKPKAK